MTSIRTSAASPSPTSSWTCNDSKPGKRTTRPPSGHQGQMQAIPADTTLAPDPVAVSLCVGTVPPIYLPPPGQPGPAGLL
jgi:hypothetical protein